MDLPYPKAKWLTARARQDRCQSWRVWKLHPKGGTSRPPWREGRGGAGRLGGPPKQVPGRLLPRSQPGPLPPLVGGASCWGGTQAPAAPDGSNQECFIDETDKRKIKPRTGAEHLLLQTHPGLKTAETHTSCLRSNAAGCHGNAADARHWRCHQGAVTATYGQHVCTRVCGRTKTDRGYCTEGRG